MTTEAQERWEQARQWFKRASEQEIESLLASPDHSLDRDDWLRIAAVAIDQGGLHLASVEVRR